MIAPSLSSPAATFELPDQLAVDTEVSLQRLRAEDAPATYELVAANRAFLGEYFDELSGYTPEVAERTHREIAREAEAGTIIPYKIMDLTRYVGYANLHALEGSKARLAYWQAEAAQGRGVVTRAAGALRDFGFSLGLRTIDMYIRPHNDKSKAVAQRLGAQLLREVTYKFSDEARQYEVWRVTADGR